MLLIALWSCHSLAQPAASQTDETLSEIHSSEQQQSARHKAAQWNLDQTEWTRFQALMQGPLGVYSPNLDPLTALGIEARNEAERTRYAELQVRIETERVTKLLAYQNAYDRAYKRMSPDVLPVNLLGSASQASPVETSDRPALFVTLNCKTCDNLVKRMQIASQPFDIYLVGNRINDDGIRTWARKAGIETDKVRRGQITLNHDAGRWVKLGGQGEFPAVLRQHNGKWVRQ